MAEDKDTELRLKQARLIGGIDYDLNSLQHEIDYIKKNCPPKIYNQWIKDIEPLVIKCNKAMKEYVDLQHQRIRLGLSEDVTPSIHKLMDLIDEN